MFVFCSNDSKRLSVAPAHWFTYGVKMIDLKDSKATLERAKKHAADLENTLHGNGGLWQLRESFDREKNEWFYRVLLDRQRLDLAKSIIVDAANNTASALDHVAAAIAKGHGKERDRSLYFPWGFTDEAFSKALTRYEPTLGEEMSTVIAAARKKHWHEVHHVEAVKQISNSGKHWELLAATGAMHAVALNTPNGQRIFQIPKNAFAQADEFEFHRDKERLPRVPLQILIGVNVEGLADDLPKSPDTILNCAFRFVAGMIEAVEEASKKSPPGGRTA
jgi:hypothetical protein